MPNEKWKHRCPESGGAEIILGIEICDRCGQRGDYIGWGHSMVEAMAAAPDWAKAHRPHRSLADKASYKHRCHQGPRFSNIRLEYFKRRIPAR